MLNFVPFRYGEKKSEHKRKKKKERKEVNRD
jgi:hypothetical protein